MGTLTTHVLDTAQGKPAAGVFLTLYRLEIDGDTESHREVVSTTTNADGRTAAPLLADREFTAGTYDLLFFVGDYFSNQPVVTSEPPFYDLVTLRFTVSDAGTDYHVPLLVSPWSYTTYRGS
ncbi:MAG: hydroxyisourate hydrolase [Chloroflexia bacterium]|nr:hydroxyisourate hydrolase [Chloroflexia bacterium]